MQACAAPLVVGESASAAASVSATSSRSGRGCAPTMELHEGGSVSSAAAAEAAAAGGDLAAACGSGGERMARENMSSRLSVWAVEEM